MVVTVRDEVETNSTGRDYVTDLVYQCPKGTYKDQVESELFVVETNVLRSCVYAYSNSLLSG